VVLAAGDYTSSPELIARYKGDRFADIEGINPHTRGDGHVLAERVGAQLVNMDLTCGPEVRCVAPPGRPFRQLLPSRGHMAGIAGTLVPFAPQPVVNAVLRRLQVTWQQPVTALFDDGAILVNARGERFCNERLWPEREIAIARQPGKLCYIVLDHSLVIRYSGWPHFVSSAPQVGRAFVQDYLRMRPDVAADAPSLGLLARRRGLPARALVATVEACNRERAAGGDLPLLQGDRWVLLGPAKAYFATTEGGVAIDSQCRALDAGGAPIPGLYAVGQNGLGGLVLWGEGLHIAWAITSGRAVGRRLAAPLPEPALQRAAALPGGGQA